MPYGKRSIRDYFATMTTTQMETNTYTPPAQVSDELPPPATQQPLVGGNFQGYVQLINLMEERANVMSVTDNSIVVPQDGTYSVNIGWATFRHSINNATVAFVLGVVRDGIVIFSQRPTGSRIPNVGKLANIAGGGTIDLLKGDRLTVWLATDIAGTVTVPNANITCVGQYA